MTQFPEELAHLQVGQTARRIRRFDADVAGCSWMIPVIDVFAGPGGLNEGFASYEGGGVFSVEASFEMEPNAVETLKLRSAIRSLQQDDGGQYKPYVRTLNSGTLGKVRRATDILPEDVRFQAAVEAAGQHVYKHELAPTTRDASDAIISEKLRGHDHWVLIGGPPCQAYSLVGRSRRTGDDEFYEDAKHGLYKEYLHIVQEFQPSVFVMENVKGLLSARTAKGEEGVSTFDLILEDMKALGYAVHSLVVEGLALEPADYVIRAENFGVPQRRHRVILLGVRLNAGLGQPSTLSPADAMASTREVLDDLPVIRSLVSRRDDENVWKSARTTALAAVRKTTKERVARPSGFPPTAATAYPKSAADTSLMKWLRRDGLTHVTLHEPRSHMRADLVRYAFLAWMATVQKFPLVTGLPDALKPDHKNLGGEAVPFADRFKVQAGDRPSSTIASHISKDGHYYIHYDFNQMRSLTVREAARLQTFPDDYFFVGNRTAQYHQVGNAVPPWLARQIAGVVAALLAG